jgi:hypothetical protein
MDLEKTEGTICYDQMLIVEKYETVIMYLYPIAQNMPRKHAILREMFLKALFGQVELFILAGKTNQISRLYLADAGLAAIRFYLRTMSNPKIKVMTMAQKETSQVLLAEVGKILGSWITRMNKKGHSGK